MECKYDSDSTDLSIDTELIDTLWNVNRNTKSLEKANRRINRYIMECKYRLTVVFRCGSRTGINRYIMECKYR